LKRLSFFVLIVSLMSMIVGCSGSEIITNANFNPVLVSPSKHLDKEVKITAKLLENPSTTTDQTVFFITPDPSNLDLRVKVVTTKLEKKLKVGNFVRIEGNISDDNPTIKASKVEQIEPQSVLAPTLKEVMVEKEQEQQGYKVILDKIEFAETETRVFITVKNETKKEINFYADYARATQKDVGFNLQKNWEADYPQVPVDIKSKDERYGIIVFAPLKYEEKKAKFVFEGFSNDIYLKPFEFEIEW